jgi:alkyldihydroxyacetonephosphate synthase
MSNGGRRWNGWGLASERFVVPAAASEWLSAHIGAGDPLAAVAETAVPLPSPRAVPSLPAETASDAATRLRHACGQSLPDLLALRSGQVAAFPDAVCFPETAEQVAGALQVAASRGLAIVPRGGGTSVVGGVTVTRDSRPIIVLSLERLRGLAELDATSRLATFRAGTLGPEVEASLGPHGLRLGHEPQSFEFSTVGGWVATRSAGQRSTGIGKIDDLVAGLEIATPGGLWRLPAQPASAAGPELRRLLVGSEGRLGVITAATLRVRPLPEAEDGQVVLLPSWDAGIEVCRELLQRGVPVEVLRLSDPDETAFATTLVPLSRLQATVSRALFGLPRFRRGCLLLLGWAGSAQEVVLAQQTAARVWHERNGLSLGESGWRRWRAERFRHPYLRDELLALGWGVDTLETAAPWARLADLWAAVSAAMHAAAGTTGFRTSVLCHLSHAYPDGASLYFTFLWPLQGGRELAQWTALKGAATAALLTTGGTITHHHGVGTMHASYLESEVGKPGIAALAAVARALDPGEILNPGVLLARRSRPPSASPGDGEGR